MRKIIIKLKNIIRCHPRECGDPGLDSDSFRLDSCLRRNDRSRAFTLVETLVAISILMLSVTGPLYYASEALKAAIYARDQITAFYLAQDAFEQIRKVRDDNIYSSNTGVNWNDNLMGCETACRVNPDESFYDLDTETDYYLYRNDIEGASMKGAYSHNSTNRTKTIFKRTVQIVPTDGTGGTWTNATEMKVTVTIAWNSRGVDRSFTAYEFLRRLNN
jgi:type II secretory pathway pseudopilin PulG